LPFKRINIIGTSGSGKTTLAQKAAKILASKHIELDRLYWKPNWEFCSDDEFVENIINETKSESWVIDGNYGRVRHCFINKIDTLVILDYPFWVNFYRICSRTFNRLFTQKELWHGNTESLKLFFSKDSIILWMLNTYFRRRKQISAIRAGILSGNNRNGNQISSVIIIRNSNEQEKFLQQLKRQKTEN